MDKGGHNSDVSQVTDRPGPPPASNPSPCRWCGTIHGPLCPYVKALELDPQTGAITRVEFLTPVDYPQSKAADTFVEDYPTKPRSA